MQFNGESAGSGGNNGGARGTDAHALHTSNIVPVDAGKPYGTNRGETGVKQYIKAYVQLGRRNTDYKSGGSQYLCAVRKECTRMREKWMLKKGRERDRTADEKKKEPEADQILWRFLPTELLRVIGVGGKGLEPESILEEQKEMNAVILSANISGFPDLIHGMEIKDIYRLINQTLSVCVPVIEKEGGMVDRFEDAGLLAFFTGGVEDGLNAAISICEKMIRLEDKKTYRNFAVCLCRGFVMAGVVGCGKRYSVLTLSAYTQLCAFLQKSASAYYARILAAESYTGQIEGFEKKYHYRFLGVIRVKALKKEERIFDIFDGDEADVRNRKRKTKMLFEKGVRLFIGKQFMEARAYFIEVLRADRDDRAAREYVFLCDKYGSMTQEERETADIYMKCL